jgi:hypothetical protein
MRTLKSPTRRRPVWQWALLALLVLVVGGAATVAGLVGLRVVDPARLAFWRQQQKQYPDDWVAVPVAAQKVPAFSTITKEQLTNPRTGQLATMMLPPSMAKKVISDFSMVNRVIGHEHHAGYPFTEQELLPQGTHSGVAGGIPHGKRAYTLDASKLKGIHDLGEGDHLDLLASIPIDMPGTAVPNASHGGTTVLASPDTSLLPKRSVVRPLVQDGIVVTPVHIRNAPMSASSLMGGASTRTVPVQEVTIAVEPEEVAPLAEALDLKYEITCVARSGRAEPPHLPSAPAEPKKPGAQSVAKLVPGGPDVARATTVSAKAPPPANDAPASTAKAPPKKDLTPGFDPYQQVRGIQLIVGDHRQNVYVTEPGGEPVITEAGGGKTDSPPPGAEKKP